ncbi:MAG: hypothetical protein U0414_11155 [Polyangiaceae bacterium]
MRSTPRRKSSKLFRVQSGFMGLFALAAACASPSDVTAPPPPAAQPAQPALTAAAQPTVAKEDAPPPLTQAQRDAFNDVDPSTLRDPFRRYPDDGCNDCGQGKPSEETLRAREATVPFGDTAVGELVVRGTVHGTRDGYAIIADSRGRSVVVPVGSRIGRPIVRGAEIIDWRVDRVKNGEVVLVEQSFAQPSAAPTTMILRS